MLGVRNRSELDPAVADELDHLIADLQIRLTNEHDDEGRHLEYEDYTPEWRAATAPPVLGNGSLTGRWAQVGRTIFVRIEFKPGGTTDFGTGEWAFTLPVKPKDLENILHARLYDMSGNLRDLGQATNFTGMSPDDLTVTVLDSDGTPVTPTSPFTWASGDTLIIQGSYEGDE